MRDEYEPPLGTEVSIRLGEKDYTPPNGLSISIRLGGSAASTGNRIYPQGFLSEHFGQLEARRGAVALRLSGFNAFNSSTPTIWNFAKDIKPGSILPGTFGKPVIYNLLSHIKPIGFSASGFTAPRIYNLRQIAQPASIRSQLAFGKVMVSHRNRTIAVTSDQMDFMRLGNLAITHSRRILQLTGFDSFRPGTTRIANKNRHLEPLSIRPPTFPATHVLGYSRTVRPEGFIATLFGKTIRPPHSPIEVASVRATAFGEATIYSFRQDINVPGFHSNRFGEENRWGYSKIWNHKQFVVQNPLYAIAPPEIYVRNEIKNRNRVIGAVGFVHTLFGYHVVLNNSRLIQPDGIEPAMQALAKQRHGMIDYARRKITPEGEDFASLGRWAVVYKTGQLVQPKGNLQTLFGHASIAHNNRTYNRITLGETLVFGQQRISFYRQHLAFETRLGIHPPVISPNHHIQHYQRYLEPAGFDGLTIPMHHAYEHFNRITPRWHRSEIFGQDITVRNLTPELRTFGRVSEEFGRASIRTQWRHVQPSVLEGTLMGKPEIAFTRRQYFVQGIAPIPISLKHDVYQDYNAPFATRTLFASGIEAPIRQVSEPSFKDRVISVPENDFLKFGATVVTANSIRVEPGYWEILMGEPIVSHLHRKIYPAGIENKVVFGKPGMSPHTIWAVVEAPQQARDNHPVQDPLHYVGEVYGKHGPGVLFGTATIRNRIQDALKHQGRLMSAIGNPTIALKRHYIECKGINFLRMGVLAPIGDQTIQFRSSLLSQEFGIHQVRRQTDFPFATQTVKPSGAAMVRFGTTRVEMLNRSIYPNGFDAVRMGSRVNNDQPYMWKGLRVGAFVPMAIGAGLQERFGTAWISYKVRELVTSGTDFMTVSDYTPGQFKKRMLIRNVKQADLPATQLIKPEGFMALRFNITDIKFKAHYIRPDGDMDNFRKGVF